MSRRVDAMHLVNSSWICLDSEPGKTKWYLRLRQHVLLLRHSETLYHQQFHIVERREHHHEHQQRSKGFRGVSPVLHDDQSQGLSPI